jgi:hypothetical protein
MLYRRFGWIQSRLLLDKQDELRLQEKQLSILDAQLNKAGERFSITRDLPPEHKEKMTDQMVKMEKTFCEYGKNTLSFLSY